MREDETGPHYLGGEHRTALALVLTVAGLLALVAGVIVVILVAVK